MKETEIDFKVHDGYVAFSSEIVRLALLSPAAFAFFIALAGEDPSTETFSRLIAPGQSWLIGGLVMMSLAVFFGLLHRFLAIDFMFELVSCRRKGGSMAGSWRTWASDWVLALAPICLFLGAISLFIAIFKVLGGS